MHELLHTCRWLLVVLLVAFGGGCARPWFARGARLQEFEARDEELRAERDRLAEVVETLRATSEELLASLEEERRAVAELTEERDRLAEALAAESERARELDEARAAAVAELSRQRDNSGDSRAKVAALEEELEAAKQRVKQLERKLETLRVCCQMPDS